MKLIRRFFTYLITIVVVLVLTYGYVYWDDLFSEDTPAGQLIGWMMGKEKIVSTEPELIESVAEPVIEAIVVPEADKEAVTTEPTELAEPVEIEQLSAEPVQDTMISATDQLVESPLPVVEAADQPEMVAVEEVAPAVVEPDQTVTQELSLGDLWKRARHSFHYRDYQVSVDSYQQIIKRTQDNFDACEELGDVYAYYGKNDEAADAYYQAASILVRLGKLERAAGFMKPLSLLDVNKARALLDQLEVAQSN